MASSDSAQRDAANPALPTFEDVQQARTTLGTDLVRTPTLHSATLSERTGCELWLKFENLQFTASFKERGALNKLAQLNAEQRTRGVVAASAGNHAQAVAYHARRLGIAATIVMPISTPFIKVSHTEVLGAEIVQVGETVDAAKQRALELAAERGLCWVAPYDDPLVIAGQGTMAIELLEDMAPPDAIVVAVGGGGMLAGVCLAVAALAPTTQVYGVQVERFTAMAELFKARKQGAPAPSVVTAAPSLGPFGVDTLADGIAVKTPGTLTAELITRHAADVLTVSETSIERACNELLELEKTVAEGAGAAGLAAVLQYPQLFAGKRVATVISGGNIDPRVMVDTINRGLARSGRLARLRVDVRDLPGSLAEITRIIADAGANIVDVVHERVFLASPRHSTRLSIEIATRHRAHVQRVIAALEAAGHAVECT